MKKEKKTQVVMLATDKAAILCLAPDNKLYSYNDLPDGETYKGFELSFLSDDEIKEGDYIFIQGEYDVDIITKADKAFFNTGLEAKKIIASTDESLRLYSPCIQCDGTGETVFSGTYTTQKKCDLCSQLKYPNTKGLPRPSNAFIQKYVEEYNKGNIITEVMVEYEQGTYDDWIKTAEPVKDKLKVKPDNTIIISPVEETWDDVYSKYESFRFYHPQISFIQWLKDNDYQVPKQIK